MTVPVELAGVSGILSVSGISRKRCKTSPSSSLTLDATSPKGVRPWQAVRAKPLRHACGVPPSSLCRFATSPSGRRASFLIRGGFAAVKFYRNTVCYCETKSLCQGLPFSGELSSGCETERLDKGRLSSERRTQVLLCTTSPSSSLTLDATSPSRGGFGRRCGPNLSVTPAACHLP